MHPLDLLNINIFKNRAWNGLYGIDFIRWRVTCRPATLGVTAFQRVNAQVGSQGANGNDWARRWRYRAQASTRPGEAQGARYAKSDAILYKHTRAFTPDCCSFKVAYWEVRYSEIWAQGLNMLGPSGSWHVTHWWQIVCPQKMAQNLGNSQMSFCNKFG